MDWSDRHQAQLLQDVIKRLDRIQEDLNRFRSQRIPDRFLPLNEAVLQMHCGKDWVKGKIADGSLRAGIDFMDRSSPESKRRRYLINPRSAQAWLNLSSKIKTRSTSQHQKIINKTENTEIRFKGKRGKLKTLLLDKNFEPAKNLSLEELSEDTCKYMEANPNEAGASFCGRKTVEKF